MGRVIVTIGGARSGKSAFAEGLASRLGQRIVYVATGRPFGREMKARIARHQQRRPAAWDRVDAPYSLATALEGIPGGTEVVLVDCVDIWIANRLLQLGDERAEDWRSRTETLETDLLSETSAVARCARGAAWTLLLVTSEIGLGLPPERPRQRVFRDLVGRVNEAAARDADHFVLSLAGHAVDLKTIAVDSQSWMPRP